MFIRKSVQDARVRNQMATTAPRWRTDACAVDALSREGQRRADQKKTDTWSVRAPQSSDAQLAGRRPGAAGAGSTGRTRCTGRPRRPSWSTTARIQAPQRTGTDLRGAAPRPTGNVGPRVDLVSSPRSAYTGGRSRDPGSGALTLAADLALAVVSEDHDRVLLGAKVLSGGRLELEVLLALQRCEVLLALQAGGLLDLRGDRTGLGTSTDARLACGSAPAPPRRPRQRMQQCEPALVAREPSKRTRSLHLL